MFDATEYAEALHDLIVESSGVDALTVDEWTEVRKALIDSLKASILADLDLASLRTTGGPVGR